MHGSGVRRPEQARRGSLVAKRLLDLGHDDWSHASLIEHLSQHGSGQSAAWHRGFLALLVAEQAITRCNADRILAAINPGHWTSTGISDAYLAFVRQFDATPRQATLDGMDIFSQKSLAEMPPEYANVAVEDAKLRSARDFIEEWLDETFCKLDADRPTLQADYVESLVNPAWRVFQGDWQEALLRSAVALNRLGWRVRFRDELNPVGDDEVLAEQRTIVLAAPHPESARTILRSLPQLALAHVERTSPCEELRLSLAAEMASSALGFLLGFNDVQHSLALGRLMMLQANCELDEVYLRSIKTARSTVDALLDLFDIDRAQFGS